MSTSNSKSKRAALAPAFDAESGLWRVHLVFIPDWEQPGFFLWGQGASGSPLSKLGVASKARIIDETLTNRELTGYSLPILVAIRALAAINANEIPRLPPSVAVWTLAAKQLLDLVARERCVPHVIVSHQGNHPVSQARTAVALLAEDASRVTALACSFPLAAHALPFDAHVCTHKLRKPIDKVIDAMAPVTGEPDAEADKPASNKIWSSETLLRAFLDMGADALVRAAATNPTRKRTRAKTRVPVEETESDISPEEAPWPARFITALTQAPEIEDYATFTPEGFAERGLLEELHAWTQPALGAASGLPRVCFRLDLPPEEATPNVVASRISSRTSATTFELHYFLQAVEDPELLVSAADVFNEAPSLHALHCTARVAEEQLLKSLVHAGRIFSPIELSLRQARPDTVQLTAEAAWRFINDAAPALIEAGMGVIVPPELARMGQQRLRMRMRIGRHAAIKKNIDSLEGEQNDRADSAKDPLISYRWEAELSGHSVTSADLAELAAMKAPLLRYRDQWVAVDRAELQRAQKLLAQGGGTMTRAAALAAVLGGGAGVGAAADTTLPIVVDAEEELAQLLSSLGVSDAHNPQDTIPVPTELRGTLRPYQYRGLSWLALMARLNLGACLADDMGLGKTIQLLAFLLHRREQRNTAIDANTDATLDAVFSAPVLLVCPTSVLSNWQREVERFAPSIPLHPHYGPERVRSHEALNALAPGTIVMTSYGLLRRDAELLSQVYWSVIVLDEAQNIKNTGSRTARIARALNAEFRVALTGTPVENRLVELWSISEFLNPGLLGSFEGFRRDIALPIERFGREDVAERLKRIVRPLILRRVKTDPTVIQDLPPKQEMTVYCTLTREQASLYQSALDSALDAIETAEGIERRGQVLALITALKQICNHPSQYLDEEGPLRNRSGKLERLREMLEETLAVGDRVLVFTQYREMGKRLVDALTRHFGNTVQFLHGGTSRRARDAMIQRFQHDPFGPQVFILSLKAGGTGLNLTAATHVFHYDRWWNPAVEDQATDRAYRIGQKQAVQVHKFLCAGTIEEKIDRMLVAKRDLAARIVGQGEQWITELDNQQLRELFSLAPNAVVASDEAENTSGDEQAPKRGKATEAPASLPKSSRKGKRALRILSESYE